MSASVYLYRYNCTVEHLRAFPAVIMFSSYRGFMCNFLKPLQETAQKIDNCCFGYFKLTQIFKNQEETQCGGVQKQNFVFTPSYTNKALCGSVLCAESLTELSDRVRDNINIAWYLETLLPFMTTEQSPNLSQSFTHTQ